MKVYIVYPSGFMLTNENWFRYVLQNDGEGISIYDDARNIVAFIKNMPGMAVVRGTQIPSYTDISNLVDSNDMR